MEGGNGSILRHLTLSLVPQNGGNGRMAEMAEWQKRGNGRKGAMAEWFDTSTPYPHPGAAQCDACIHSSLYGGKGR
ncbi:MAG: hypothetical protein ABIQ11_03175 [Saprospiraceae bacterium]